MSSPSRPESAAYEKALMSMRVWAQNPTIGKVTEVDVFDGRMFNFVDSNGMSFVIDWINRDFPGETRRGSTFRLNNYHRAIIVQRPNCTNCGKRYEDHSPTTGKCLFLPTTYADDASKELRAISDKPG